MLKGKKILVGICGSIAAYKITYLVRLLVKENAEVKIIMTPSAHGFVTPLSLSVLSKNPVLSKFTKKKDGEWNNHIDMGLWADMFLIAPASANTLGKMAHGICDNLLLATYLSAKCKVLFAPAMDLDMFKHPTTINNIKALESYGNILIPVEDGELASGLEGEGRMAEPETLLEIIEEHLKPHSAKKKRTLIGKTALVTAGPTYEPIDPVRFIGNHSSGKMGFAIAEELASRGAEVILVSGPSIQNVLNSSISRIDVTTADEMYNACFQHSPNSDLIVMTAAVADFTPNETAVQKIKKNGKVMSLSLKPTKDILKALGDNKSKKQVIVGFALETENELKNAKNKLKSKNLDLIILNSLNDKRAGFGGDENKVTIIGTDNKIDNHQLKTKKEVAIDIANAIDKTFKKKK